MRGMSPGEHRFAAHVLENNASRATELLWLIVVAQIKCKKNFMKRMSHQKRPEESLNSLVKSH